MSSTIEQLIQETPQDLCALWDKTALEIYEAFKQMPVTDMANMPPEQPWEKYLDLLLPYHNFMDEFRESISKAERVDCYAFDSWLIGAVHRALSYRDEQTYGMHMKRFINHLVNPNHTMAHYISLVWG